ncbi:hypothetical protein H4219_000489 [Mycoemilia scoparia]|uniref:DUF4460 domain-containing protein n=1 Tax=Mycoemilia scoparia TaxID=417184 RepID=A0A9W8A3M3_9FUNG|nr:hypothetical protein H4219_000489 [Mycoemilia scoparia]
MVKKRSHQHNFRRIFRRVLKKIHPDFFVSAIARENNEIALHRLSTKLMPIYTNIVAQPGNIQFKKLTLQIYYHTQDNKLDFHRRDVSEVYRDTPDEFSERLGKVEIVIPEVTREEVLKAKGYSKVKTLIFLIRLCNVFNIELSALELQVAEEYISKRYRGLLPELYKHQNDSGKEKSDIRLIVRDLGVIHSKILKDYVNNQKIEADSETLKKIAKMVENKNEFATRNDNADHVAEIPNYDILKNAVDPTPPDTEIDDPYSEISGENVNSKPQDESTAVKAEEAGDDKDIPNDQITALPLNVRPSLTSKEKIEAHKKKPLTVLIPMNVFFDGDLKKKRHPAILRRLDNVAKQLNYDEWKDLPVMAVKKLRDNDEILMSDKYPGYIIFCETTSVRDENLEEIRKTRNKISQS